MSAHLIDSEIYGHLWGTDEVRELFEERAKVQSWLEILTVLAEAQAHLGIIPTRAAEAIRAYADVDNLDLTQVATLTRETGHSTLGLIRALQEALPEGAREWVYYGATVQDLTDTWTSLVLTQVTSVLRRDVARAVAAGRRLATRHADTVMSGRTHGQVGLPITFGFKAAVWSDELSRHQTRLEQVLPRVARAQLGGGLGTMEFWGDQAIPLLTEFSDRLGLGAPGIPWLTARDGMAEFVSVLGMVTATFGKIGQEVYQLQRPELGEVSEGGVAAVGSITMPHKINPEISEHLVTLARVVRPHSGMALEAMLHEHERDGRAWKTEWLFLPETCILSAAAVSMGSRLLEGLQVDEARMLQNLADRKGYVLSEPVMRELSTVLGKHAAHDVVYRSARRGLERGVSFEEQLRSDPAIRALVPDAALRAALDVTRALGAAPEFARRAGRRGTHE
jgi:adenylosuccinate lyase